MIGIKHYIQLVEYDISMYSNKIKTFMKNNKITSMDDAVSILNDKTNDKFIKAVYKFHKQYSVGCEEIILISYAISDICTQFNIVFSDVLKIYTVAGNRNLSTVNFDAPATKLGTTKLKDLLTKNQQTAINYLKILNTTYNSIIIIRITEMLKSLDTREKIQAMAIKAGIGTFNFFKNLISGTLSAVADTGTTKLSNL